MTDAKLFLVDNVVLPVEAGLLKIGVNSAFKAGVLAAVLTAGLYWTLKPASAFDDKTGKPRPWSLLECDGSNEQTHIPWYVGSLISGYAVNLII
jgi:hypothetical protein